MADVTRSNFYVLGKNLDKCEELAATLLNELWPSTSLYLLEYFERMFAVTSDGTLEERRKRIIAAHRQRGGLSKKYFQDLGNVMGQREVEPYTVTLTEGAGYRFIVHSRSLTTNPMGPATLLPGKVCAASTSTRFEIVVLITGTTTPVTELENTFDRLKPAYTTFTYSYVLP